MRVAILDYDANSRSEPDMIDLHHRLSELGHHVIHAPKTMIGLRMRVSSIQRMVREVPADAWIVCSGSLDVLKWFAEQRKPAFALFGRRRRLSIAGVGPDHVAARREVARRLIALGHRRIVVVVRESQRVGGIGSTEQVIFDEMIAHGHPVGAYNLPEWEDSADGFHQMLEETFRVTPPTALIIDEPFLFHAAKEYLAQRGTLAPKDVSLVCTDPDPTFAWCRPSVAHIKWDHRPVIRQVIRWVGNVAQGKRDVTQTLTSAEFVDGGTVGPVPA